MTFKNKITYIFVLIFFLISFVWLLRVLFLGQYPDFQTQYYVPKLVFSGVNPYLGGKMLHTSQVYPPNSIFFFLPLSLIPYSYAPIAYTIISINCLLLSLFLLLKIFKINFYTKEALIISSLAFISFPIKFTLGMGQVNLIILFFLVLGLFFLNKNKKILSGILFGIPLIIKLIPIFLLLYFLIKIDKKVLYGIFLTILVSTILVLLFINQQVYLEFFKIFPSFISSWKLDYYNQALSGLVGRSFGTGELANILKILISGILVCLTFFIVLKNKKKDFLTLSLIFGTLVTLNLIVNTFSWQHHFVLLIIPFFAAYFTIKKIKNNKSYLALLITSYILVSINFREPYVLPVILQSHVLYGSLILLFLQLKLLVRNITKN